VDVNGTRMHLLLGRQDWEATLEPGRGLEWDGERNGVILRREQFRFPTPPGSRDLRPDDRRGAAPDRFGNWFTVGPDRTDIRLLPAGSQRSRIWWPREEPVAPAPGAFAPKTPPSPPPPAALAGLAVTAHHYLVVGVPSLPGLLVFDLHGGGPPVPLAWPGPPGGFVPVDMAPSPWGGVWILDRAVDEPGRARIWLLDRYLRVVQPGGGRAGGPIGRELSVRFEAVLPVSIEGLPDGSVLVLDREAGGGSAVRRFRDAEPVEFPFPSAQLEAAGHDLAFVPAAGAAGTAAGRLLVADAAGNQALAFLVSAAGDQVEPTEEYYPMRMFTGKGIVAAGGKAYYDLGDRWLALHERGRRRYQRDGFLVAGPFEGRQPDCRWHRLLLDGCIPPGTEVAVESRAANTPGLLAGEPWQVEPAPYLRGDGPEVPAYRPFPPESAATGAGTWELLLQRATGRHLELRLSLRGNGRQTPRLGALRVYFPRFSYLREYLPDVYQEDAHAAFFLDRYLANLEGVSSTIEGRIESAQSNFDAGTVDQEFLPWLASWLGGVVDPEWEEARRRLFVRYAVELFRQRGTHDGLIRAVRLATDACPDDRIFARDTPGGAAGQPFGVRVVEQFLTRAAPGVVFGDPTDASGPRAVTPGTRWTPAEGAERLEAAWQGFLERSYGTVTALNRAWETAYEAFSQVRFPPLTPEHAVQARDWRRFVGSLMAVGYDDVGGGDAEAFRAFLSQRYRRVDELNAAWGLSGASKLERLDQVQLPAELPRQAVALRDWVQFVSIALPTARRAHRFSVLVPVRPEESDEERRRRVGRVERVVLAEKPAHTSYDIKTYLAAFRVGEARAGLETIVGEGSRFVAIVLGRGRLGAAYAPGAPPWDVPDRLVVGRDRVAPAGGEITGGKGDGR
jgi:phage tail-like protein